MSDEKYRLDASVGMRRLISQLERDARVQGLARSFAHSLNVIRLELSERPGQVGQLSPSKQDQALIPAGSKLEFREHTHGPVRVHYAVHEQSKTVWLKDVRLLPALN
jgi:hypothetical protein